MVEGWKKPQYFGIGHKDPKKKNVPIAVEAIDKHGNKNGTLYIEFFPVGTEFDWPFYYAVKAAEKKGMKVVYLDPQAPFPSEVFTNLLVATYTGDSKFSEKLMTYQQYHERENDWFKILKNAKKNDIVMVHPLHLKRMKKSWHLPAKNVHIYPDKTIPDTGPLSPREVKAFKRRMRLDKQIYAGEKDPFWTRRTIKRVQSLRRRR